MPEWWTYSLSDFLLFSPRTYYRLLARYNLAVWPAQLVTLALGLMIADLLGHPTRDRSRLVAGILAALWAWVGWAFVARRYATINWAAAYFAWFFAVQALLLGWLGAVTGRVRFGWRGGRRGRVGGALFAGAMGLYPLLAPALGRNWTHAEVFGTAPDPTVLGTMGLLLSAESTPHLRWALLVVPLAWCVLSGATLWAMGAPPALILLAAAALVVGLMTARARPVPGNRS